MQETQLWSKGIERNLSNKIYSTKRIYNLLLDFIFTLVKIYAWDRNGNYKMNFQVKFLKLLAVVKNLGRKDICSEKIVEMDWK